MRSAASLGKQARLLAGYSRVELARAANSAPSTVGRIESGALDPTWSLLTAVLTAAGYRLGDTLSSPGGTSAVDAAVDARSGITPELPPARLASGVGRDWPKVSITFELLLRPAPFNPDASLGGRTRVIGTLAGGRTPRVLSTIRGGVALRSRHVRTLPLG